MIRLVLFVDVLLACAVSLAQSRGDTQSWPPPNPEKVGSKEAADYWPSYIANLRDFENQPPWGSEEETCLDKFTFHKCRELEVFNSSEGDLQVLRVYLPPLRATLPSVEYNFRALLPSVQHKSLPVPNEYVAMVPVNLINDGPTVLAAWKGLAASARPFDCEELLCNVMYLSSKPVPEQADKSVATVEEILHPIGPSAVPNLGDKMYIIFCSQYAESATGSMHLPCTTVAVIYPDGSAFLVAAVAQSPDDLQSWPPPSPNEVGGKELADYWASYVTRIAHTDGRVRNCVDKFNGLTYPCKELDVNSEWHGYSEVDTFHVYLPPFRATLPRIGLRVMLEYSDVIVPNRYIALVPVELINDGPAVFRIWRNLAFSKQPFGCKGILCDVMHFGNDGRSQDEKPDHESREIILCSQYVEGTTISAPFSCITVAVIHSDGKAFLAAVVMEVNDMSDIDLDLKGGDIVPVSLFSLGFIGAKDSRPQVRNLIQAALSRGPNAYSVRILPGGSVLAQRSYVTDEIIKSIWNTRTWYENTWLRFDLVPTNETYGAAIDPGFVSIFLSMLVEHSKTPDLAPEHWHAASAQESQKYQEAIIARLQKEVDTICKSVPYGDGELICRPALGNEELLNKVQAGKH